MQSMVLPKQHGAWSMLLIPFLLGVIAGMPRWEHIPLFLSWLFLYLATTPLLTFIKLKRRKKIYLRWFLIFFALGISFVIYPIFTDMKLIYFGIAMIPFFLINMYFSKIKKERALANDIAAIIVFAIGGLAAYFYGTESLDLVAFNIFFHTLLYYIGCTFYIKTMIREKKNIKYKYISYGYHLGLILLLFAINQAIFILAYIPGIVKAIVLYGKKIPIKTIGIIEIVNALYFFIVMAYLLI